uniref:Sulfotransferase n=1 Tax=Sinocyclocheilus anshuiensis TaxID=1608454 RepID=A0A671R2Y0_9TELE
GQNVQDIFQCPLGVSVVYYFTDNWEKVKNFQARPDDILIATYPKAGTTWVSYILDLLYFGKDDPECQTSQPIYMRVPFLESCFKVIPSVILVILYPHFLSHVLYILYNIFFHCNAKDDAVSYFHFDRMNMAQPAQGDWNTFLQKFMEGKNVFGPWYDHVERLCSFLGLSISVEEREKITKGVQFDAMKQNKMTNYSTIPVMDFKISPLMRKGKVGDWKSHFTVAQNEQFDEVYKQKMKNTTVKFRTEI